MQNTLIQRYLGNKTSIGPNIVDAVANFASPGDLVFDAFSGSLGASAAFRQAGYEVACNDINHFSWVFANAYFTGDGLPNAPRVSMGLGKIAATWADLIDELRAPYCASFPKAARGTYIFDTYCEEGRHSEFRSSRGSIGRRRFFTPKNAAIIDRALSRIRFWAKSGDIGLRDTCILTASLLSAVEKVSNTQGTYHDFPRNFIDTRATRDLAIKLPQPEVFNGLPSRYVGRAQDSLEFAKEVPPHKLLYLDPPYNFRQYTSYYFMLNMISSYFEIADLEEYFSNIQFVRGQNMDSDFRSTFCSKGSFIPSLKELISRSKSEYVVLSYFDGRNHWGKFKDHKGEPVGRQMLTQLFLSDLFEPDTLRCIPLTRQNYQSYGGFTATEVQEFLFVGKRSKSAAIFGDCGSSEWTGKALD